MKIVIIILRVLLGALFIFTSIAYFFKLFPQPELSGNMKTFSEGMNASGYLMPFVKAIELICGVAYMTGRFIPLTTILIFPIVVNIVAVHLFLAPEGLPVAIFILIATLVIAYQYKEHFKPLLASK